MAESRSSKKRNPKSRRRLDASAPDRVAIMDLLDHAGRPLKRRQLVEELDVKGQDSIEVFRRRLKAKCFRRSSNSGDMRSRCSAASKVSKRDSPSRGLGAD